jgi:hypothetical protein
MEKLCILLHSNKAVRVVPNKIRHILPTSRHVRLLTAAANKIHPLPHTLFHPQTPATLANGQREGLSLM